MKKLIDKILGRKKKEKPTRDIPVAKRPFSPCTDEDISVWYQRRPNHSLRSKWEGLETPQPYTRP